MVRLLAVCLAALVLAPASSAAPAPQNLRAFLLRATEPEEPTRTFARTPAFSWNPVQGATGYEFQLSSSRTFAENAIIWESDTLMSPVTMIPLTLPWTTGAPFSFYARVRAQLRDEVSPWSERYGIRMRAPRPPASLSSGINPRPGMVRWTPVEGATAYEVAFQYSQAFGEKKKIKTATTAADLREYYTLHNWLPNSLPVSWRVRAIREVQGRPMNNLPAVTYGPWSTDFTTYEPPLGTGTVDPRGAVSRSRTSDVENVDVAGGGEPHELVPGFWWTGRYSLPHGSPAVRYGDCPPDVADFGVSCNLFHVYVYTDEDCVNRVHVSDLVGSPAYVPRLTGPLEYPADTEELAKVVDQTTGGVLLLADGENEGQVFDAGREQVYAAGLDPDLPQVEEQLPPGKVPDRRSGLWDSDWPDSRYYWTVVPAVPRITPDLKVEYHDVEFGEAMCEAGELITFGKTSAPAIERENGVPFVSGMTSSSEIRGATNDRPQFFGRVVVAWKPAPGAAKYQVQWSKKAHPFRAVGSVTTPTTAAMLSLDPGVWFYRVRGLDRTIPGRLQGMTWSEEQYVKIRPRTFTRTR